MSQVWERVPHATATPSPRPLQVYLEGEEALTAEEAAAEASEERWPPVKAAWRQRCKQLHPEWEFRLWNMSALEELLTQRYPWFVPTFEAYPQLIHKGEC